MLKLQKSGLVVSGRTRKTVRIALYLTIQFRSVFVDPHRVEQEEDYTSLTWPKFFLQYHQNHSPRSSGHTKMVLVTSARDYINRMLQDISGMKVLILDSQTVVFYLIISWFKLLSINSVF